MKAVRRSSKFFRFWFSRLRRRFVVLMVLCLWLVLSLNGWSVAQETKTTPQEWQINGILAALDDEKQSVKSDAISRLRQYKPADLRQLSKRQVKLAKILYGNHLYVDNQQLELESIRRVVPAIRDLIYLGEAAKPYFMRLVRDFNEKLFRTVTPADTRSVTRLLIEFINESEAGDDSKELSKSIDNEIKILLNNSSISQERRAFLNSLISRDDTMQGFSVREATESISDTSVDLKDRCIAAKFISKVKDLAISDIKNIIDLVNEVSNVNSYYNCSGTLSSFTNSLEVAKPFVKEIVAFLNKDTSISQEALKFLVDIGDLAKPFVQDIIDYVFGNTNSEESILLIPKLGETLTRPHAKDISGVIKDKSKPLYIRSAAASVLADLNLMQPYTDDVKELISNISSAAQQESVVNSQSYEVIPALENMGEAGKPFIEDIAKLLKLENVNKNRYVQFSATLTLLKMGNLANPYMSDILNIFKDKNISLNDRQVIGNALSNISPLDLIVPLTALENLYDDGEFTSYNFTNQNPRNSQWRSFAYFLSGGSEEIKTLLRWIGRPNSRPKSLTYEEGKKTLETFEKVWAVSGDLPEVRKDLAQQIAEVTNMVKWQLADTLLLQKHYDNLSKDKYTNADSVRAAINALEFWQWFNRFRNVIFIHFIFWVSLIFVYPKSLQVQAIFFWNPWVRRILGFGYVGFFLTWIPFLRDRLLAPFRASLIADAGLQNLPAAQAYFPHSEVIPKNGSDRQPLANLKGQMILEGESGLGKTMFLCHLVKNSKRNIVYLTAKRCEKGVIEAIQAKLLLGDTVETSFLKDKHFLRNLIYSGAIDVCIDGLNEVTADTRAKITQFVEQNFKGNILLTTQPMIDWNPPGTASIYTLQPLRPDQIQQFLLSRPLPKDAKQQGDTYKNACAEFLSKFNLGTNTSGQPHLPAEELAAVQRVLSNPMDLSIIAQMIAIGENPDLFNLQKQQYKIMAADYEKKKLREFPQKKFAEVVYQMRLADQEVIPADTYEEELTIMEHHKMVVRQWREDSQTKQEEYLFRHDKIMEYFIVQTFLGNNPQVNDRLNTHKSDPRFRGVYFLLATLLPLDAAQNLREDLIQHAADTKDHSVSDTFIQLLRSRSLVNN